MNVKWAKFINFHKFDIIFQQQPLENNESSEDQQQQLSPEIITKHPLQNAWTLWYLEVDRTKAWEDMQNIVSTFDTVEDFWSLYNHIKQPAEIKSGNDYSLFKQGIRPMWEDEANNKGGKWTLVVGRNQKEGLNKLWLDTVLCLIGEAFDHSDEVCGAVVNVRSKGDKICELLYRSMHTCLIKFVEKFIYQPNISF